MRGSKAATASEGRHIEACKLGPCVACIVRARAGLMPWQLVWVGCDYNHTKSGNIRRGHMMGFAMCLWHHRGHPCFNDHKRTREQWGPSLMDGSRLFHETYGSDDQLIDLQLRLLEGEPWEG